MKKGDIVNLIKYHYQKDEDKFYNQCFDIAKYFEDCGDVVLAQYVESILSKDYNLIPQSLGDDDLFQSVNTHMKNKLYLPLSLNEDIKGVVNSIVNKKPITKFLFTGSPGTGKTEVAKHISNLTNRRLLSVNFTSLVDSRLGETLKRIEKMFVTINNTIDLNNTIILFDELDIIALDRINKNDLREMGRAASLFIKCIDNLNPNAIIIATTNLENKLDRAIKRRFDYVVNFDVYNKEFLAEIAISMAREYSSSVLNSIDSSILQKIIEKSNTNISPAELRNIIKISFAFSNPDNRYEYLSRIFSKIYNGDLLNDIKYLYDKLELSYREIELLTGVPKSTAQRIVQQVR